VPQAEEGGEVTAKKRRKDDARPADQHPAVKKRFEQDRADKAFYARFVATDGFRKWRKGPR